jgi:hypothetical protein
MSNLHVDPLSTTVFRRKKSVAATRFPANCIFSVLQLLTAPDLRNSAFVGGVQKRATIRRITVPDPRFHPKDPRSQDRADNAGFSIVLALAGFLALGIMAVALTEQEASQSTAAIHETPSTSLAAAMK